MLAFATTCDKNFDQKLFKTISRRLEEIVNGTT